MPAVNDIIIDLFIIFLAAKIAGEVFSRLRQPAVIGELLAGILIGPFALGLVGEPSNALVEAFHGDIEAASESIAITLEVIAELGVILLLFYVGLETRLSDLLRVGNRALTVGVLGIAFPFIAGYIIMSAYGSASAEALFVAVAMVATSVGITARVLRDLGVLTTIEARIILGAAVIDDILAIILLAMVSDLGTGADFNALDLGLVAAQAIGFTVFVALIGTRVISRYHLHLDRLHITHAPLVVSLILMLGLAALASVAGIAAIIGAFLAGMVVAEASEHYEIEHAIQPVYEFLVPFFFVIVGMQVDPGIFIDSSIVGIAVIVSVAAILTKLIGAGLGGLGLGRRPMAIIGTGMVPRGEVGLIVANLGLGLGIVSSDLFSVVVVMSIVTTVVVPPALTLLYRSYPAHIPVPESDDPTAQSPPLEGGA